jgi:hypothetical protein
MGEWLDIFDRDGDENGRKVVDHQALYVDVGPHRFLPHGPCSLTNTTSRVVEVISNVNRPARLSPGETIPLESLDRAVLCDVIWAEDPPRIVPHESADTRLPGNYYITRRSAGEYRLSASPHGSMYIMQSVATRYYLCRAGNLLAQGDVRAACRVESRYVSGDRGCELFHLSVEGEPLSVEYSETDPRFNGRLLIGRTSPPGLFELHVISDNGGQRTVAIRAAVFGSGGGWWLAKPDGFLEALGSSSDDPATHFRLITRSTGD